MLVVVAHPDDETFGLGGVIAEFTRTGAEVSVLCLTHGEASALGNGDLGSIRSGELRRAADHLGVKSVEILDYPDGGLASQPVAALVDVVADRLGGVDGMLVFGPGGVTGHPDHVRATEAALKAGERTGVPVLGWVIPEVVADTLNAELGTGFRGVARPDVVVPVDRSRHVRTCRLHASQVNPVLWRRLELLGDEDWLIWMRPPVQTR